MPRTVKYVPILKSRQGELEAFKYLEPSAKAGILPVVEIAERNWDFKENCFKKSLQEHLTKLPKTLAQKWGTDLPILIDLALIDPAERMDNGSHPLSWMFDKLIGLGVKCRPVVTPRSSPEYLSIAKTVAIQAKHGACLRIDRSDVLDLARLKAVPDLIGSLGLGPALIDLLVDLGPLVPDSADLYRTFLPLALANVPHAAEWASFTIASGAFPANLGGIEPGLTVIPRLDWKLWKQLASNPDLPAAISFGDYAIQHPTQDQIDPRVMVISASMRYTSEDDWLVFKGRSLRRYGHNQYFDLCKSIVNHPRFAGTNHCQGDVVLQEKSLGLGTPGSPSTYRYVGSIHHLTCASHQVASRIAASGSSG